jgi:hypothetical protein
MRASLDTTSTIKKGGVVMDEFKDERISKQTMEEYETIRRSGVSNMFDIVGVQNAARRVGLKALAKLGRDDYIYLLQNFSKLMKGYGVKQ